MGFHTQLFTCLPIYIETITMKTVYFTFLLSIAVSLNTVAQIINIPDAAFKTELLSGTVTMDITGTLVNIDSNQDGEISITEADVVNGIYVFEDTILDYTGVEHFSNLERLFIVNHSLISFTYNFPQVRDLDLIADNLQVFNPVLPQLLVLDIEADTMSRLDVSMIPSLLELDANDANFTELYIDNPNLNLVKLNGNNLTEIDLSRCPNLGIVTAFGNPNLNYINVKNNTNNTSTVWVSTLSTPLYVCADEHEISYLQNYFSQHQNVPNLNINSYCSFGLGGDYNEIQGSIFFDESNNGCSINSPKLTYFPIEHTTGSSTGRITSNAQGDYYIPVGNGTNNLTLVPENPSYWNVSPPNFSVSFPTQTSPVTQDFCVSANGSIEDLEVMILEMSEPRPGFDVDYRVVVRNKGNQSASGIVTLEFQNDFMTLLSTNPTAATPAVDQLRWSFSNLSPLTNLDFDYTMTLNTPTATINPLDIGDFVNFTATVTGTGTDAKPADNIMDFKQEIFNSYDPNDKTCLQGATITPSQVGDYVYYKIRFENLGTASAVNVVVKDEINLSQLDMNTLVPLDSSHDYVTRVRDNNVVEFIFENINLDFNDATNDGYVVFKIKTLSTLSDGDTFDNTAGIYFDFNAPIITNTEVVSIMSTASIGEVTDESVVIFPNPSNGILNVNSKNSIKSASLVDLNGRMLKQMNFIGNETNQQLDFSSLGKGIYFLTVTTDFGFRVEKLVIK
mgnify:CR=1 FL=1